jgi:hypothetical protein
MTYRIRRYLIRRTEFLLGVSVTLLSLFALLAIFTGVGRSTVMPGRYAFVDAARSLGFMAFLPILGIAVIVHGMRRSKTSEWIWGLILLLWSFFSWWWIPLSIYDGSFFFKIGFVEEFITTSWPLIVFVFQGIALTINGAFEKQTASAQDTALFSEKEPGISRLDANDTHEG